MPDKDALTVTIMTLTILIVTVSCVMLTLLFYVSVLLSKALKLTEAILDHSKKLAAFHIQNPDILKAEEVLRQHKELLRTHNNYLLALDPITRTCLDREMKTRTELTNFITRILNHSDSLFMTYPSPSRKPSRLPHEIRKLRRYNSALKQEYSYIRQQDGQVEALCKTYCDSLNELNIALAICIGKARAEQE